MPSYGDKFDRESQKRQSEAEALERAKRAQQEAWERERKRKNEERERQRERNREQIRPAVEKFDREIRKLLQAYLQRHYDTRLYPPIKQIEGPVYVSAIDGTHTMDDFQGADWYVRDMNGRRVLLIHLVFRKGRFGGWKPDRVSVGGLEHRTVSHSVDVRKIVPTMDALFAVFNVLEIDYTYTGGYTK